MADFFKRTQVPQTQSVQSRTPSGPDIDREAHAEAQRSRGGLGGAINDLLGVAHSVSTSLNKVDALEEDRLEKNFSIRADADVSDFGSYSRNYMSRKASEEGRELDDYTSQELEGLVPEIKSSFKESKGLNDKEYASILDKRIDARGLKLVAKQHEANQVIKKRKAIDALSTSSFNNLKSMTPDDFVTYIQDTQEQSVGPDAELQMTGEEFREEVVRSLIPSVIQSGDPELADKLDNKSMRKYFNEVEGYDNIVAMARQKSIAVVNKRKAMNFDSVEEGGYTLASNGGFQTEADVDDYLASQNFAKGFEPSAKSMFKLEAALKKEVIDSNNTLNYSKAIKSGDFTFIERNNIPKKDADTMKNKFMSTELGISDATGQGTIDAINSGEVDAEIKQYGMGGYPIAPFMVQALSVPPTGGPKAIKAQARAFLNVNALLQDTPTPTSSFLDKKTYSRHMFTANLMDKVESGVIDDKEFFDAYTTYTNDMVRNVDSYGSYISPESAQYMNDESHLEWANNFALDAPWTIDDNNSPKYISRQIKSSFNLMIDAGYSAEEARDRAEEMFEGTHMRFENLDGSEGVMPLEFKDVLPESLGEVAANLPQLQAMRKADEILNFGFTFRNNISVRPSRHYEKTKMIEVYYDGKPVSNTLMTREQFDANWNTLKTKEAKRIRKSYENRLKKQSTFNAADDVWRRR